MLFGMLIVILLIINFTNKTALLKTGCFAYKKLIISALPGSFSALLINKLNYLAYFLSMYKTM